MTKAIVGLACALAASYGVHRLGTRWGVSDSELKAQLPGDDVVSRPMGESTRGITIDASVKEVWPWIVQIGFPAHRAGWYTPYFLDRLTFGIREQSADELQSELQHLEVGDRVPDSADWSVYFTVAEIEPPQVLVLHSTRHVIAPIRTVDFSCAFILRELPNERTRLLIRARTRFTPLWARAFAELVIGPADFVNVLGMLHGIKSRAERAPSIALEDKPVSAPPRGL
jgi:hypothetical protein